MFSYYSGLSRRRSSHSQNATSPPLPYASSINEGNSSPLPSPSLLPAPASPSPTKQLSAGSGDLGSPFSVSNNPISLPPTHALNHQPSLPALSEDTDREHGHAYEYGNEHGHGRDRMTSAGSSRAPLVARDFGLSGAEKDVGMDVSKPKQHKHKYRSGRRDSAMDGEAEASKSSESFKILPGDDSSLPRSSMDASLPAHTNKQNQGKRELDDPSLIPPPSIHDAYVSKYVKPLAPISLSPSGQHESSRPGLNRSSSAPGHPHSQGLLPSAIPLPPGTGAGGGKSEEDTNQPIFKIFDAQLSEDGTNMSKKLRGYLEVVLKGQEEVGRMHLELEGLGLAEKGKNWYGTSGIKEGTGKAAEKRERGVDEIMRRLDELSDTLRDYHQLGTPKLTFPHQTQPVHGLAPSPRTPGTAHREQSQSQNPVSPDVSPTDLTRARTVGAGPASPNAQKNYSGRPRAPTLMRSNTAVGQVSPPSIGKERSTPRSPLVNTFRPPSTSSSSDDGEGHKNDNKTKNSDLPPERLDNSSSAIPYPHLSSPERSEAKPFFDPEYVKNSGQGWLEDVLDRRDHGGEGPGAGTGKKERRITDSPVEMHYPHRW
ncbi:hypothetical protein I317_06038 [Kwoniella heveanensis CBS 569]|nr:hypothetical protein I317_06038 [Kwoniella heveanensis CBS 569]